MVFNLLLSRDYLFHNLVPDLLGSASRNEYAADGFAQQTEHWDLSQHFLGCECGSQDGQHTDYVHPRLVVAHIRRHVFGRIRFLLA